VLPGAAIDRNLSALAGNSPGGKAGMARVFAVRVQILFGAGAVAVQIN
jgi:hypothetical protein